MDIRLLDSPEEMAAVEALERLVWPGNETEIVPVHMLRAVTNNGGALIGAYDGDQLVGFVFGFPGIEETPSGPRPKHASHMAGIHPEYRDQGLGFTLKRAQWQVVRGQGLDHIVWTYDPLQSRNANLNIAKLGAVCNTYLPEYYGEMRDGLNVGLPSDRFKVDWWLNTPRVEQRLQRQRRPRLDLEHFTKSGASIVNPATFREDGLLEPFADSPLLPGLPAPLLIVEIPPDFPALKSASPDLALVWRLHTRRIFLGLFAAGYIVTDFVFEPGVQPRSFYVLSDGNRNLT
ncbi:MAG: GNAT family N-acetyltransferase [Chloroflexi bacterium]|nr:GNAT family N-acetyltransferase [Chloroflexota bacterium]